MDRNGDPTVEDPSPPVIWKPRKTFPALKGHQKVWSGENIRDRMLLIAAANENVFRLEFRIARKYRWFQYSYKWLTGRSSWSAVAIVTREAEQREVENE